MTLPLVRAEEARLLLMGAQGLLDDPARAATHASLRALVERMGFVQLDSINVVERAHHLTLASRSDGYRHEHLSRLLERERSLFEHWTHDASAIPTKSCRDRGFTDTFGARTTTSSPTRWTSTSRSFAAPWKRGGRD